MADQLYGLTAQQVLRLKGLLAAWENGELRAAIGQRRGVPTMYFGGHIGLADAAIAATAAAATTISSGTVSIWKFTGTNTVADTSLNVTAYNFSTVAVSTSRWLHLKRHIMSGKWLIDFESCT